MKLDLTDTEVDYLMRLLYTRPYGEVFGLILKVEKQANEDPRNRGETSVETSGAVSSSVSDSYSGSN